MDPIVFALIVLMVGVSVGATDGAAIVGMLLTSNILGGLIGGGDRLHDPAGDAEHVGGKEKSGDRGADTRHGLACLVGAEVGLQLPQGASGGHPRDERAHLERR